MINVILNCFKKLAPGGTTKLRNENETKRNEMKRNETKRNEIQRNETKNEETKRNEMKYDKTKRNMSNKA